MSDSPPPDRVPAPEELARLVARTRGVGDRPADCPEPGLLAGLAENRLLPREADDLIAHAAVCAACRTILADLASLEHADAVAETCSSPRGAVLRRWRLGLVAAAAAALVVAVVMMREETPETHVAVAACVSDLAAARPDLFGEFVPLTSGRAKETSAMRGALALLEPAGVVLGTRPDLRWEPVPGVERWRVLLRTAEGDAIWTAESTEASMQFPAGESDLVPGTRYIWDVSGSGPLGAERAARVFDVASGDERRLVGESLATIDRIVPPQLRPLLRAQIALHRGLFAVASTEIELYVRSHPGDAAGLKTLAAVRRAVGDPARVGESR